MCLSNIEGVISGGWMAQVVVVLTCGKPDSLPRERNQLHPVWVLGQILMQISERCGKKGKKTKAKQVVYTFLYLLCWLTSTNIS